MNPDIMQRLCDLVEQNSGIMMPNSKSGLVETRLRRRSIDLGMKDVESYLRWSLEKKNIAAETPRIIDLMTTNTTHFFREIAHYDYLKKEILPAHKSIRPFKVWSAACSSGEEAYSAAMIMIEHIKTAPGFKYALFGTDISLEMVKKARDAVYPRNLIQEIPAGLREKHFILGTSQAGRPLARVVEQTRKSVKFSTMNLVQKSYPMERDFDLVFLRNILIYFDHQTQKRVVDNIASHIRPGGYLFVGHSETMNVTNDRLTQVSSAVYRVRPL